MVQDSNPMGRPETSVRNCHYSLRNDPEERSSQYTVVIFEVFMTMILKIAVLRDVTPCSLVVIFSVIDRVLGCYILELCRQVSTFRSGVLSLS